MWKERRISNLCGRSKDNCRYITRSQRKHCDFFTQIEEKRRTNDVKRNFYPAQERRKRPEGVGPTRKGQERLVSGVSIHITRPNKRGTWREILPGSNNLWYVTKIKNSSSRQDTGGSVTRYKTIRVRRTLTKTALRTTVDARREPIRWTYPWNSFII